MFSFNNSDLATLAALCVVNFLCAGTVHRAVLLNSGFVQRRLLFEGLSLFGFVVAIALTLLGVLMWVRNPAFVIACTTLWFILCLVVVVRIWRGHRNRVNKRVLELPELFYQQTIQNDRPIIMPGKKTENLPMTTKSGTANSLSARAFHDTGVEVEKKSGTQLNQPVDLGSVTGDKLKKYHKKREYKSASISNLSVYRQRSKKFPVHESAPRTGCK